MAGRFLACAFLIAGALILGACDGQTTYTVVNETDRFLQAWILYAKCEDGRSNKQDSSPEEPVVTHASATLSDVFSA